MLSQNGLPKVDGLDQVFNDNSVNEDKDNNIQQDIQQDTTPVTDGQVKELTDDEVLSKFKSTKDLLKSYKEIQGFTTRVSQENKEKDRIIADLQENLNKLRDEVEIRSYRQQPGINQGQKKSFTEMLIENPEEAISMKAAEISNTQRIAEVLEEEELKNQSDFQERVAYVKMLSQNPQFAPLSYSPKGVKKLFEIADKARGDNMKKRAHESLKYLFGEDVDIEALKGLVKKKDQTKIITNPQLNLSGYMPDTTTSTRTGADIDLDKTDLQRKKAEAIKTGDASIVAGAILREALLK
jgi:hypothetical protein